MPHRVSLASTSAGFVQCRAAWSTPRCPILRQHLLIGVLPAWFCPNCAVLPEWGAQAHRALAALCRRRRPRVCRAPCREPTTGSHPPATPLPPALVSLVCHEYFPETYSRARAVHTRSPPSESKHLITKCLLMFLSLVLRRRGRSTSAPPQATPTLPDPPVPCISAAPVWMWALRHPHPRPRRHHPPRHPQPDRRRRRRPLGTHFSMPSATGSRPCCSETARVTIQSRCSSTPCYRAAGGEIFELSPDIELSPRRLPCDSVTFLPINQRLHLVSRSVASPFFLLDVIWAWALLSGCPGGGPLRGFTGH